MKQILVVDDDRAVREALERALSLEGYDVELAAGGAEALAAVERREPDAVVLDVLMPGLDGLEVCRLLRKAQSRVPILMLTVRDDLGDRIEGLDAGADDYLGKPFELEELLARVRALLRRAAPGSSGEILRFADLTLDLGTLEAQRGKRAFRLSVTEANVLEFFLRNPRQVLSRALVFERVWGSHLGTESNTLDVYVGYLRRKTEAGGEHRLIHTVRGAGYALRER
ncbi:MAG TPA: response regulator transcription factor [Gaiellaceae bacterium]